MTRAPDEMSCQELVELVTDYIEDALPGHEHTRFEAHLSECAGCRIYVEQMRTMMRLAGQLTPESLSPDARETLLRAFRRWKEGGRQSRPR